MKIKFLGQGLHKNLKNTAGGNILHTIKNNDYHTLNAFVAFVKLSGLTDILDELINLNERGIVQLFIGIDLNGTSKEALELLLKHNIKTAIVYSPNNITYHPKIYLFKGDDKSRLILGSSNLTSGGLFNNVEASVRIDLKNKNKKDSMFINDIHSYYEPIMDLTHESCQLLTNELLTTLIDAKIVISEKQINKGIALSKKKQKKNQSNIKSLFKNLQNTKNKLSSSSIKNKTPKLSATAVTVTANNTSSNASMWIQTGSLTGGSANILDLAMTGNNAKKTYKGPSDFFGVSDKKISTDISIRFNDKTYKGNTIKYAENNGSWRLQLKGIADISGEKEKFTVNTKDGAFKNKIMHFTKLSKNEYSLNLLSNNELISLQTKSSWAYSGKRSGTKIYGPVS